MRLARFLPLVVLTLGLTVTSAHASAILVVNGSGILTGATGVDVGGTLYDVTFVDGSCAVVFDGCDDAATDFTFTTQADALAASQALLDQVFLDGGQGNFDSSPNLTFGCTASLCQALTPFEFLDLGGPLFLEFGVAQNTSFSDGTGIQGIAPFPDTTNATTDVYARWTPSADTTPVPEPSSLTLLSLGLPGMAGRRWRQRKA